MAYRKTPIIQGNIYHIYNRGVNRQPIFFNENNWLFFLSRIKHYFQPNLVSVLAFCLMPNHFHLIVSMNTNDFGQQIMQPFIVSYTKAINKQQNRVGPIFQGPYKTKLIESDESLLQLSRYIHLNPVEANLVRKPEDWQFSSYQDFIGDRKDLFLKKDQILNIIGTSFLYKEFVEDNNNVV